MNELSGGTLRTSSCIRVHVKGIVLFIWMGLELFTVQSSRYFCHQTVMHAGDLKTQDVPVSTSYLTEDYFARPTAWERNSRFLLILNFLHVHYMLN